MFNLLCCEGSQPISPNSAESCDEFDFGGADFPPTSERIEKERHPNPAQFKRQPENTEFIEESVEVARWRESAAEDSGSRSSFSCGSEKRESQPARPEDTQTEDEWTPEVIAFYYRILNGVGKALKKSLTDLEVDTDWCITTPSCIKEYVRGLIYTEATPECFIIAVLYLERFLNQTPSVPLTASNVQLLYLTALTVAIKYVDDSYFNSEYYARIGGLQDVQTLNRLEMKFLFSLNFDLMVDQEQYRKVERSLMGTKSQTKRRRTNSKETKRSLF